MVDSGEGILLSCRDLLGMLTDHEPLAMDISVSQCLFTCRIIGKRIAPASFVSKYDQLFVGGCGKGCSELLVFPQNGAALKNGGFYIGELDIGKAAVLLCLIHAKSDQSASVFHGIAIVSRFAFLVLATVKLFAGFSIGHNVDEKIAAYFHIQVKVTSGWSYLPSMRLWNW